MTLDPPSVSAFSKYIDYVFVPFIHWRSKRIDHTEAKDGDAINIVTNLIMTSNYTENKQKTNLDI